VYDKEAIIMEYLKHKHRDEVTARYTHGLGIDEPLSVEKNQKAFYYYHADGLGSIVGLTDVGGSMIKKYAYDSFGNVKPQRAGIGRPYTYTAREYDHETGLYFYRARYYDPKVGRFLSRDPVLHPALGDFKKCGENNLQLQNSAPSFDDLQKEPQNLNPYAYTRNNPINFSDSLGLACGSGLTERLVPDRPWGYNFTRACEIHDLCYDTCGMPKERCDSLFWMYMLSICASQSNNGKMYNCSYYGTLYYLAVLSLGEPAYKDAQSKCRCKVK
jgi:RHS repeat-associated protein